MIPISLLSPGSVAEEPGHSIQVRHIAGDPSADIGPQDDSSPLMRVARPHPNSSGINPMQHPGERYRLPHVLETADPRHGTLDSHSETGVGDPTVFA